MDIRLHGDFRNEESVRKADEHEYSAVTRMLYHYFEQFIHLMCYFWKKQQGHPYKNFRTGSFMQCHPKMRMLGGMVALILLFLTDQGNGC